MNKDLRLPEEKIEEFLKYKYPHMCKGSDNAWFKGRKDALRVSAINADPDLFEAYSWFLLSQAPVPEKLAYEINQILAPFLVCYSLEEEGLTDKLLNLYQLYTSQAVAKAREEILGYIENTYGHSYVIDPEDFKKWQALKEGGK